MGVGGGGGDGSTLANKIASEMPSPSPCSLRPNTYRLLPLFYVVPKGPRVKKYALRVLIRVPVRPSSRQCPQSCQSIPVHRVAKNPNVPYFKAVPRYGLSRLVIWKRWLKYQTGDTQAARFTAARDTDRAQTTLSTLDPTPNPLTHKIITSPPQNRLSRPAGSLLAVG